MEKSMNYEYNIRGEIKPTLNTPRQYSKGLNILSGVNIQGDGSAPGQSLGYITIEPGEIVYLRGITFSDEVDSLYTLYCILLTDEETVSTYTNTDILYTNITKHTTTSTLLGTYYNNNTSNKYIHVFVPQSKAGTADNNDNTHYWSFSLLYFKE